MKLGVGTAGEMRTELEEGSGGVCDHTSLYTRRKIKRN